jgi:hypothetical protein
MNKVHEKTVFYPKQTFYSKVMTRNLFFCEEWIASSPAEHKGKNFSFPICAANFCKTFCTCSPSSLRQDLTVKMQKNIYLFIWSSWARNGSFEVFFEKKELRPLEVRPWICVFLILNFSLFLIYSDESRSNECAYCFDFLKYDFYYFYRHAKFCLCTLYFQYPSAFGNFLYHASQLKCSLKSNLSKTT